MFTSFQWGFHFRVDIRTLVVSCRWWWSWRDLGPRCWGPWCSCRWRRCSAPEIGDTWCTFDPDPKDSTACRRKPSSRRWKGWLHILRKPAREIPWCVAGFLQKPDTFGSETRRGRRGWRHPSPAVSSGPESRLSRGQVRNPDLTLLNKI